jgi:hypothetical protein
MPTLATMSLSRRWGTRRSWRWSFVANSHEQFGLRREKRLASLAKPPALTPRLQQKKFDGFRQMFNHERPHEGLNNKTPGSIYQPSSMMLPRALIGYVYPKGFVIRRVNNSADISWHKGRVFVSQVLRFEDLGFELVAEDFYKVFFRDVEIGEFDAEALRLRPVQALPCFPAK